MYINISLYLDLSIVHFHLKVPRKWIHRIEISVKSMAIKLMCWSDLWENVEDIKYKFDIKPIEHDINVMDIIHENICPHFSQLVSNIFPVAINVV